MQRLTKNTAVRAVILLPFLISNVIAALVWFLMLDFQVGIVNEILAGLGLDRITFFGGDATAIPTIALVNVWRHMGYTALLIFAGLQTIPDYVYEAAAVDGSTEWKSFWRITLPLLRPILALVLVITVTGSFQVFDTVAVTTRGGPGNASRVIQYYIIQKGFAEGQFGYASAISLVLFVILGDRRPRPATPAQRGRVRPGLRGTDMATTIAPSHDRHRSTDRAQPGPRPQAVQPRPRRSPGP